MPNPPTFKVWIFQFLEEQTPKGDLARDIKSDPDFPDSQRFEDLEWHLQKKYACIDAMTTLENAWKLYRNKAETTCRVNSNNTEVLVD